MDDRSLEMRSVIFFSFRVNLDDYCLSDFECYYDFLSSS